MRVALARSVWLGATMLAVVAPMPTRTLSPPDFTARVHAAPQAAASAIPTSRLAGRVVADTDRAPIQHALVTVHVDGKVSDATRTNHDGEFDVSVPESGAYGVVIARNGFVRRSHPASVFRAAPGALEIPLVRAAAVSGRVIDAAGRPLVSIRVRVAPQNGGPSAVSVTDDRGMFRVGGLAAGRYTTVAEGRPEYQSMFQGEEPPSSRIDRGTGASSNSVVFDARPGFESDVTLTSRDSAVILPYATVGGTITGRIVDEFGIPAEGVSVRLWGARQTDPAGSFAKVGEARITDDRGEYRLFHIPAGRYVLEVTDDSSGTNSQSPTWLPVYYPGTNTMAEAMPLEVGRSQEFGGVDTVFTRRRGARVFGFAMVSTGQPFQGMLRLAPVDTGTPGPRISTRAVAAGAGGSFEFTGLPPGEYVLRVTPTSSLVLALASDPTLAAPGAAPSMPPGFSEFAIERVSTREGDAGPIALQTRGTATVSGQIVWESVNTAGTKSAQLSAVAAGQGLGMIDQTISLLGVLDQNRPLTLEGLAGTMRFRATSPDGWWLKSATIGGVDAVMSPVTFSSPADSRNDAVFVLSDTAGRVEGTLRGTRGELVFDAQVVAFSTERERWFAYSQFVLFATPEENARFTLGSLPPGSYFVAAVRGLRSVPTDDASMADLLETLVPSARRITIADRQRLTLTQRLDIVTR